MNKLRGALGFGALFWLSAGCLSLQPLESYSEGAPESPPLPLAEPAPELAEPQRLSPEPSPEAEAALLDEGLPGGGEITLDPVAEPAEAPVEAVPAPCGGAGEFLDVDTANCYLRSAQNAAWVDAQTSCQMWGGQLVSVDSQAEDAFLGTQLDTAFWIGASDRQQEGRMLWSGGASLRFTNWGPGQPDDFQGREDCIVKTMPAGLWNDLPCRNQLAYVCERNND